MRSGAQTNQADSKKISLNKSSGLGVNNAENQVESSNALIDSLCYTPGTPVRKLKTRFGPQFLQIKRLIR